MLNMNMGWLISLQTKEEKPIRDLKLNNLPIMSGLREITFGEYGYHGVGSSSSLD